MALAEDLKEQFRADQRASDVSLAASRFEAHRQSPLLTIFESTLEVMVPSSAGRQGDGFIELGLYQLKECFLARALRGYDIWKSMNYNNIRMPLDPDMRTSNPIQIITRDVNYPRYGNKKGRSLHPGGKIVCHHLRSPFIIRRRERTPSL
jgi:hypothetical protein